MTSLPSNPGQDPIWFVAHARPRCEKKIVEYCGDLGLFTVLPCYQSKHKYRGKTVVFEKPLFPGYVFLKAPPHHKQSLYQSDYIANVLDVFDQQLLERQLDDILKALNSGLEIQLAPEIGQGSRVQIKCGPLAGMEGWVEARYGMEVVLLRLDFIGQAAAIKLSAGELEPI